MGTGRALTQARPAAWPPAWIRWLPPVLIVLAVVLELGAPPRYFFGSLLSAAVLLGALVYRPPATAATGVTCVVILLVLNLADSDEYDEHILGSLVTLGVVIVLVTLLSLARVRTLRQLNQVRAVAQAAQLALLRPLPERMGPVRMAGFYQAATDEALIGGDLYCVRQSPYGLRVLVGDVRGKGIGATGTVATVLASFREAATVCPDLPEVADRIEASLALDREDAASGMASGIGPVTLTSPGRGRDTRAAAIVSGDPADMDAVARSADELFATAVLLEFPPGEEVVRILDRGHPPLIRLGRDEVTPLEPEYGLPLGLGELAPSAQRVGEFAFPAGRMLVAYSDGVTEARDRDGAFYPLEDRLASHFTDAATDWDAAPPLSPADVVTFVQHDVTRWTPVLGDDLVVVVLQRCADERRPDKTGDETGGPGDGPADGP